jgi:large repetitive protein
VARRLAVLAVEEHETAADEHGVVIRGRCRLHGDVDGYVDPRNLSFGVVAQNAEGHPRDDPTRREPWIDLRDTTIDFHLVAPREGSATIAAGQAALAGDAGFAPTQAVLDAWDALPVGPLPSDYASSAFSLDLMILAAVLRPPFLSPAKLRTDGLLEPDPSVDAVRLTLPRIRLRISQESTIDAPARMEILSLGVAGLDDPIEDLGVLQAITMEPPYAFIGPGRVVGLGFRSAVLDLSDGATPPDVLAQFGFDEAWTGVYFPEIRLFVAPQGAEGLAVNVGVQNLLLGIGASSGITGDFLADVINQGTGPLTVGARFYREDGTAIGLVRHDDGTSATGTFSPLSFSRHGEQTFAMHLSGELGSPGFSYPVAGDMVFVREGPIVMMALTFGFGAITIASDELEQIVATAAAKL